MVVEIQSSTDPVFLEKEHYFQDTILINNEKEDHPCSISGLKKHQSLNELDKLKLQNDSQNIFDSKSHLAFPCEVKGTSSSCSDFDIYFEKVSKETSSQNKISLEQDIFETMLNSEKESNTTLAGSLLKHKVLESNNSHFSKQARSDIRVEVHCSNEKNIQTDESQTKVNINLEHNSAECFNLEEKQIENKGNTNANQINSMLEFTNEKEKENQSKETSSQTQILNLKSESAENSNKVEVSYLETLKEMKNALLNITVILQEEHSEKATNISKVTELIEILNEIKLENQKRQDKEIKTLTNAQKNSSSTLIDGQKCSELCEDISFSSPEVQHLPWSLFQIKTLSDSLKMYQNILVDLGKAFHDHSSSKSDLSNDDASPVKLVLDSSKCYEEKDRKNTLEIISSILEESIESIFQNKSEFTLSKNKSENFTPVDESLSTHNHQISFRNENSVKEIKPKIVKDNDERSFERIVNAPLLNGSSPVMNQSNSVNNVMKIVKSIENRTRNEEILNEQEVTEILKHGKEKVDTIINQNQLLEKQRDQHVDSQRDLEKSTGSNLGRCLSENHKKMFQNLKNNLFSTSTPDDSEQNLQLQIKSIDKNDLYCTPMEECQNMKDSFVNETNENENSSVQTPAEKVEILGDLITYDQKRGEDELLEGKNTNELQRSSLTRSFSETNLIKKELKFSISTDDLDSNQLFSIHVIGDNINVTTSSRAMASSTIDVTSTENGFNLSLKSKSGSQSNFNFASKFDSFLTEKHFLLDDAISPCSSSLGIHRARVKLDEELECEEENTEKEILNLPQQDNCIENVKEETCMENVILEKVCIIDIPKETTKEIKIETTKETTDRELLDEQEHDEGREDEENIAIDDTCSIDTVIENHLWNVGLKKKSDSLLQWNDTEECLISNDSKIENEDYFEFEQPPRFLSISSSSASFQEHNAMAFDMDNLDNLSTCSQDSSDLDNNCDSNKPPIIEEKEYYKDQKRFANTAMFLPHKELYSPPKVRVKKGLKQTIPFACNS